MPRYIGTFRYEKPTFGFLMVLKDGKAPPNLSKEGGVFLSASVAVRTLGKQRSLLRNMDGDTFSFFVRQSEYHPNKLEAWDVKPVPQQSI